MKKTKALVNRLIEEVERHGIIQSTCDKYGITRQSFYRWMKEDQEFLERVNEALSLGEGVVNDVSMSNLLSAIRAKDMKATMYWLSHRHAGFRRQHIHKVDPDVLGYYRALAEASKTRQIQEEISNFADPAYEEAMNRAKEDALDFFKKWDIPIVKSPKKKPPQST